MIIKHVIKYLYEPTCTQTIGHMHQTVPWLSRMEAAAPSKQGPNTITQHPTGLWVHLASHITVTHTYGETEFHKYIQFMLNKMRI